MIHSQTGMGPLFQDIAEARFSLAHEEGRSKAVPLVEAIRENIEEGMSIHFLGLHYRSHAAIYELFRQFRNRRPNFTIVAGTLHGPIMTLFHAGMIKKAITAFVGEAYPTMGPNPVYNRMFNEGQVSFENWSFLTMLGILMPNPRTGCLGTLSAAQVDKFGNLNTTVIPEKKMLITGSGGANDVMSTAREVVVIVPQSKERFVEKLPFVTSPGAAVKTLISTLGVFEKLENDQPFTLTSYFEDQLPKGRNMAIREVRAQCGWDLRVVGNPKKFPVPGDRDLATLRMFDPDRYFLRD